MLRFASVIMVVIGAVWVGQGLGYVGGSFMTGQSQWVWIGAVTAICGIALLAIGWRRRA